MEKQKTIFKDKDGYFIEQDGNRISVKPVGSKEKDESKWTFTDGENIYTPSQVQKKRPEYSSAYDPYALTDLLDWTAENTIGLPIKLAAQTETGQKAIPYVGKVLSVVQPSKWYGTITGKGAPWSEKNTGFGDSKHDKSLNTLVDWALSPALVKGESDIAKIVGKEATMQLASKGWSPAVKYVLGKPTVEQPVLSTTTYSATPVIRSETYLKPWKSSWTPGNKAKANVATKYYWSNKPDSFFELVKDTEPESYSVHFKTPLGSITHGEKMGLFAKVADEVPEYSTLSTYGYLTKGGVHGVKRFETDFGFQCVGSRQVHMKDGTPITIPVLRKINKETQQFLDVPDIPEIIYTDGWYMIDNLIKIRNKQLVGNIFKSIKRDRKPSKLKEYASQLSEINPKFDNDDYVINFRKFLQNIGYEDNLTRDEILKIITDNYKLLSQNNTGLVKNKVFWNGSPTRADENGIIVQAAPERFVNIESSRRTSPQEIPGIFFGRQPFYGYSVPKYYYPNGRGVKILDEGYDMQPYLIKGISKIVDADSPKATSLRINGYIPQKGVLEYNLHNKGNSPILDSTEKGLFFKGEYMISPETQAKSLYPHPETLIKDESGNIILNRSWNNPNMHYAAVPAGFGLSFLNNNNK